MKKTKNHKAQNPAVKRTSGFPYAIRSFIGYLEGTQKAAHTIKNYRLDLLSFQKFLASPKGQNLPASAKGRGTPQLERISPDDLEHYHAWLRSQGLKTNTRRRKLLTVQRFLNYLARRSKVTDEVARKFPTPHKIERIPLTVPSLALIEAIRKLPSETILDARNCALLWTLAETGCQVSEVTRLKARDWQAATTPGAIPKLSILGKSAREIPVSEDLYLAVLKLQSFQPEGSEWLFQGFNKFGSLGSPITARGIELLVRSQAAKLGFPELTPRTFRHSIVMHWFAQGLTREEIQKRLGLKTAYAFRVYDAMLG